MNKSVIDSIVKPYRTRGESKYMVEEIYFSDVCKDNITEKPSNATTIINPQNAWFDNGKYRFQLPALWYQSTCNNKAIGLRSIKLINDPVAFKVNIVIYSTQSPLVPIYETNFVRQHRYGSSFMEIISQFVADLIRDVQTNGIEYNDNLKYFTAAWYYNYVDKTAKIEIASTRPQLTNWLMKLTVDEEYEKSSACGFYETFNCKKEDIFNKKLDSFEFDNVWNRESIFVHASFVNTNSFGVLGMSGDFYPKPSKMYRFNGNSPEIWFELSYDGMVPQRHRFARFIIELAFIYNDADYMAE